MFQRGENCDVTLKIIPKHPWTWKPYKMFCNKCEAVSMSFEIVYEVCLCVCSITFRVSKKALIFNVKAGFLVENWIAVTL